MPRTIIQTASQIKKERVIALDYFRGACLLVIIINHASLFSSPFYYLVGAGRLWTSAAEIFFILSGVTLSVVRGKQIRDRFWSIARRTWRRAGIIYLAYLVSAAAAVGLAISLADHHLTVNLPAALPSPIHWGALISSIVSLSYAPGWANFLMYYAVYLLAAPFILRFIYTRFWLAAPIASIVFYAAGSYGWLPLGSYQSFSIWQLYFIVGIVLGRFREPIIGAFYHYSPAVKRLLSFSIISLGMLTVLIAGLIEFNFSRVVAELVKDSLAPSDTVAKYAQLASYKPEINKLLLNGRAGILRPVATMMVFSAAYLIYQKYKTTVLKKTHGFVAALGRDSMVVFMAQAITIPLISAIPLRRDTVDNFCLTSLLISLMWLVTKRDYIIPKSKGRLAGARGAVATITFGENSL